MVKMRLEIDGFDHEVKRVQTSWRPKTARLCWYASIAVTTAVATP